MTTITHENYCSYLNDNDDAKRLLETIPWVLDSGPQGAMNRTLCGEASRLFDQCKRTRFSIITPLYNTDPRFLSELLFSCKAQTWWNWELILTDDGSSTKEHLEVARKAAAEDQRIQMHLSDSNQGISASRNKCLAHASGDFICFLDHDDLLHPQALGVFARYIKSKPDTTFFYSNEVKLNAESTQVCEFLSKPDFDPQTLLRINYIAHLTCIKKSLLNDSALSSGEFFQPKFDGVEDHDFFLRVSEQSSFKCHHIPLFCYYWRRAETSTAASLDNKPHLDTRGREMLEQTLSRRGVTNTTINAPYSKGRNRFYSLHKTPKTEKLLVVIPYKDHFNVTKSCLDAFEKQETNLEVTVILVNNNSNEATKNQISEWTGQKRNFHYVQYDYPGTFNYASINNCAVREHGSDTDLVLFLNNDVDLTAPNALDAMAGELQDDSNIAFVGIKLWYPEDNELQHGGVKVRPAMVGSGYHQIGHISTDLEFAHDEHSAMCVTFACAMVYKKKFEELNGLEDEFFPNGFGDVDINLRALEKGYSNFYLGTIDGIHHESKSRLTYNEDVEFSSLHARHLGTIQQCRINQLGYDLHLIWNQLDTQTANWMELPIRYRLADKINDVLKNKLKPIHRLVKRNARTIT